jgi:hypothetical protein
MKQIDKLLITGVFLILIVVSCNKDEPDNEEVTAIALNIEFNVSYSGTAVINLWERGHNLYFLIDYPDYTPYDNFHEFVSPYYLQIGHKFVSPYEFEPGYYTISGFWDWNDSEIWEDYEPYISSATIDITGYSQPKINIFVVDKSQPDDDGWVEGEIRYSGTNFGSHHIYLDVFYNDEVEYAIQLSNNPINLIEGPAGYFSNLAPGLNCWLRYYLDINDNGFYDSDEPIDLETWINISPGLPTKIDVELH